ncbi:Gfo/Idh/MocA family oxidoreductase [Fundicoccus sp. Sow4_H7]|uniref:Gfo/Idh/MocA family oxidoreductase n=1 Tax=Fundicoccus sp. Sow4_H7 TaxID=3438784 RepID=UPI003F8E3D69
MLTIAYIGNGKSTNRYHLPFSMLLKDKIKIKSIYSRSGKSQWPAIDGIIYTSDISDIYLDDSIDLVVITTSNASHFSLAKEALEHGKHVLLEKPFTQTYEEAKSLFDLAKSRNLFIQCYQNRRFDSDFLTVQKVIESGKLGDLLELEMHFDYFRSETPEQSTFSAIDSFLYGHGCHTLDQVIGYFGKPDKVHSDVRQLLGSGKMNDYFDLDLYYGALKVSVKSSYFRIKARPSFIVYGKKGMFVKETKDRQEEHLKQFYMPDNEDFGVDTPEHYGTLTYISDDGVYHEEKIVSEIGDYSRIYEGVYQSIVHGAEKVVKDEDSLIQIAILEEAMQGLIDKETL